MPSDRPAIPAEITREILIESGHRCAVCGTGIPLERAHIIPWHKSKEHKAEDLICLCANCHERADKEKWGEKTLREYKQKPWVMRQYEKADDAPGLTEKAREVADDRQNQATLEAYFDRMTELLLEKRLRESQEGDEVRSIARTRTLAVLRSLDKGRKGQVVQFLYESGLIGRMPVVVLKGANLVATNLFGANLSGVNLSEAELSATHLIEADLRKADLSGAYLIQAYLSAARLNEANLNGAYLVDANLIGANLGGANLKGACLNGAELRAADLGGADLRGADLHGADLRGANLSGAKVTDEQLAKARSLAGATLPDGTKVPDEETAEGQE